MGGSLGAGDRAEPRIGTRRGHEHPDLSGNEAGSPEKRTIGSVCGGILGNCQLLDRKGLAGEDRFVGHRVMAFEDQPVRRNQIASMERDHVAGNHVPYRDFDAPPAPKSSDLHCHRAAERIDGILGLGLLEHVKRDRSQHDENDDDQALPIARRPRDQCGNQQDRDQRLDELFGDLEGQSASQTGHGEVGPVATQPLGGFRVAQSV